MKAFLIVLLICLPFWFVNTFKDTSMTDKKSEFQSVATLKMQDRGLDWYLTKEGTFSETLVFYQDPGSPLAFLDGAFWAVTEEQFKEVARIKQSGSCPSPFVNQTGYSYLIIAKNPAVAQQIKLLQYGTKLQVKGRWLSLKVKNGEEVVESQADRAKFMLVESIASN